MLKTCTVLLIGSGKLAHHLQQWNSLLDKPNHLLNWSRKDNPLNLNALLNQADIVWLAISDSAIQGFYENYLTQVGKTIVHFSGAFYHPNLLSAHPLMSFASATYDKQTYANIHFSITGFSHLESALPNFKNKYSVLTAEQKKLYHALCVCSGNFPQLIWSEVLKSWNTLGIPQSALDNYIHQCTENFITQKNLALTGPLIRKDLTTIENNLNALSENPLLKNIYQSFKQELIK